MARAPYRTHPLEDGLWNDQKWDRQLDLPRAEFEEIGFFAYLFGNERQRPSGIYRVTDEQLAGDTRLPIETVRAYLEDLQRRGLIVRDGIWVFIVNYFKRVPKTPNIRMAVDAQLYECKSEPIREVFFRHYPICTDANQERRGTEAKALLDYWFTLYKDRIGETPTVEGGQDMECAKKILSGRTLDQAKAIVLFHFDHADDYYREKGLYGLTHIRKATNAILARMARPDQPVGLPARTQKNLEAMRDVLTRRGHRIDDGTTG